MKEKKALQAKYEEDTDKIEYRRGFIILADNSESDFSDSSASDGDVSDSTTSMGSRKRSFV